MKDVFGITGLCLLSGGLGWFSPAWAFVAAGGVLILWATAEDLKRDR